MTPSPALGLGSREPLALAVWWLLDRNLAFPELQLEDGSYKIGWGSGWGLWHPEVDSGGDIDYLAGTPMTLQEA